VKFSKRNLLESSLRKRMRQRAPPAIGCVGEPLTTPEQDPDFSDEFCHFLQTIVPSVDAAELLIRLRAEAPQTSAIPPEAQRQVQTFSERGLVALDAQGNVRYQPASEALAAHAALLQKLYIERPVTLFRVIYGLRDAKIRSFADAFKLTKR
jgi:hypothetical protein